MYIFCQEMFNSAPTHNNDIETFGQKDFKTDIITSKWHPDIMHELYKPSELRHFLALFSNVEIPAKYARK